MEIAGFALSVAAVAGAIPIVSKELVMCVHGYLYVTVVQPYKIGDLIEFNQFHGRVVDIDMFATTLVELDKAGQRTGKVAEFPNGLLLTHPLINSQVVVGLFKPRAPGAGGSDGLPVRATYQGGTGCFLRHQASAPAGQASTLSS